MLELRRYSKAVGWCEFHDGEKLDKEMWLVECKKDYFGDMCRDVAEFCDWLWP